MIDEHRTILVVEDSPEDFEALRRAFRHERMRNPLVHVEDGDEALDYLFRRGEFQNPSTSPRPSAILLDLNLPGTDGREVLSEIKDDPNLRLIPVIVLTTSSDERDVQNCYRAGANSYIQKPVNFDGFISAIRRMREFWFEVVILPEPPADD